MKYTGQDFTVNEVELIYRKRSTHPPVKVEDEIMAVRVLRSAWDDNKIELVEQFKVILLDAANICLGVADIASGGLDYCLVDPRLVFAAALKGKAIKIILAHNHPSGNLKPSTGDIKLTRKLCEAGLILDVPVVDHFILTRNNYLSMASHNLMP